MKTIKILAVLALVAAATAFALTSTLASSSGDLVTVSGKFTSVTRPNVTLKSTDGTEYLVHIGPPWYWDENSYSITTDGDAEVYGKLSTDKKEIFAYTIKHGGNTIKLADENGIPFWRTNRNNGDGWGKGYGPGNGRGNGNCPNCPCGKQNK